MEMTGKSKTYLVLAVIAAVALVVILKNPQPAADPQEQASAPVEAVTSAAEEAPVSGDAAPPEAAAESPADGGETEATESLPVFVEVGAHECVPCKMMQPVLDELRSEYAGRLRIEFADVWKDQSLGVKYNVRSIPTQVIYDASGEEVFRHVGYWPKEEIDAKLKELGIAQ